MCTKFNLKIDESTELLDTKTFDDYYTNELLLLSDTIKQSCFEISIQFLSIPLSEVHAICYRSPHNPLKKSIFFKS